MQTKGLSTPMKTMHLCTTSVFSLDVADKKRTSSQLRQSTCSGRCAFRNEAVRLREKAGHYGAGSENELPFFATPNECGSFRVEASMGRDLLHLVLDYTLPSQMKGCSVSHKATR